MKLPNGQAAVVPESKVTGYLLSTSHRDGRHKAAFFLSFGFAEVDWQTLASALLSHASEHDVAKVETTPFGKRYVVESRIETPGGRTARIRSVWFVENDEETPRFVTAYPLEGAGND